MALLFHEAIRKYREEVLCLSQEEASKRLHITQPALSQYESGKRQIPIEALIQFQKAYSIPAEHMMKMLFQVDVGIEYSPMVLREHSYDADLQRVVEMIYKHRPLFDFLKTLTYADEKSLTKTAEFLPHFKRFVQ
ncbi:helix-turn-helix domain-containing protein [Lederbergia lenta]|uniref:Plasmid maintenance system antidote protein n=1 Tax=Lederbergia lenta TaxID=1467 RepID=A0A2X4WFY3_LEDLE|nr:helix-turn-helix transcriptional regulator [Lederbergia lenta]MEC2323193.1 helix-turn-helix transcriptional regulator [Lederbergia lenta]SQI62966.1 Plasmid maintenance system antidote protein [Lederbergia lenta]